MSALAPSQLSMKVGEAKTTARAYGRDDAGALLVLAHGAGAPQTHPWMIRMAQAIAAAGLKVVTFDFLYSHAGRRVPDRAEVLEATWREVVDGVRALGLPSSRRLLVGGKSMGGRIATQVAAAHGFGTIEGLVLLGYPLHPPGKPEQLRSAHLPRVEAPMLFVQGARDAFGSAIEMTRLVDSLPAKHRLLLIADGDHSLARPKRSGESREALFDRVAGEVARFCGV